MNQYINPRSKLLYHTDRLAELRTGKTSAPVNVEIDVSNRCSRGCLFCHFAYTHTRGPLAGKRDKPSGSIDSGDLMDVRLARDILTQLAQAGVKSVTWTGGGEPTLHPQFNEIIKHAHQEGLEQGMYSHGGHIDAERAALLKQWFTFVYVSLDECTRDNYKSIKGVDGFEPVLSGIRHLVAAEGKATVGIGFLLANRNVDDVDMMVSLGRGLGVDYVQFRPIVAYEQSAPGQQVEDTTWINRAIINLRKYAGDEFVQADPWRFEQYRDWQGHGYKTCHWSALQTVITPNGRVWRCTNKREYPDGLLGNLAVEPFARIWERSGGACAVNDRCRILCRGHAANVTLDAVMTTPSHENFI